MQTLRRLFQLSARELWVLVQAAVLLPAVRCALRFVTITRLQLFGVRTLTGSGPGSPAPMQSRQHNRETEARRVDLPLTTGRSPETIARMVRIAAEHGLYRAKCLEQSLVLRWLLQRQGIDARIVFGARKDDEQMQAHAWVEVNGVALSEDNGVYQDFAPLDELVAGN
ncbi:MAG TPA: lasso peptide biosynthesis B2 protein [Pyrinomonadaceae bacterium]